MEDRLLAWLVSVKGDPYAFVLGAFPWGETGTQLEKETGPEAWQVRVLCAIRDGLLTPEEAIQICVASGHGIGKSACVAWIILWAFSTLPDTRGWVTANTENQLKTKTWAELGKWFNLFIGREHFTLTATALLSKDPTRERTWRIDQTPWSEKNTEAFAGMHNKGKRILLVMDEASAIPDIIHEVAEGALTDSDTEIIWVMFGNPTKNTGRFKESFPGGMHAANWNNFKVDSRTVSFTNKSRIERWRKAYGEESDFFKIRVRGEFPSKGLMEFFNADDVKAARKREVVSDPYAPLALGVDVARFGANNSVIWPRKGRDARSIPRRVFSGVSTTVLATKVFEFSQELHADGIMVDGGGVGGGVVDNCRQMHLFITEVQFGSSNMVPMAHFGCGGEKAANMRAGMYCALRAWMAVGCIPDDDEIERQLLAIRYTHVTRSGVDFILLEPKEDLIDDDGNGISIDDADALALTFAIPLAPHREAGGQEGPVHPPMAEHEYNPYSAERMNAA